MEKRFCTKCGEQLQGEEKFCQKCGNALSSEMKETVSMETIAAQIGNSKSQKKTSKKSKFLKGIGVVIALLIVSGIFTSMSDDGNSKRKGSTIQIKAEDLANAYEQDSSAAEEKYKNKSVKVTGQLINKYQFKNSQNYGLIIYDKISGGKRYGVIVDVPKDNVDVANKMKKGDFVNVEGNCVGIVKQDDPDNISIQIHSVKVNE